MFTRKSALLAVVLFVHVLLVATPAYAINQTRFCANLITSYEDTVSGQDVLVNSTEKANNHWAVIEAGGGTQVWSGYMSGNCTPFLSLSATLYKFWVTTAVRVATNKIVWVFPDESENWEWMLHQQFVPANPTGDSTITATFTATEASHASLVASTMSASSMVNNTYKVYAYFDGLSHFDPVAEVVKLGEIPGQENDAFWKSVVGHELGHYVAHKLFGNISVNYNQNATQAVCNCDHIPFAPDRSHCLQSREQLGAARNEGWGHFYASTLFNSSSHSTAPFGYYKAFLNPSGSSGCTPTACSPPVTADALISYEWRQSHCNASDRGTELDWMGFFYFLHTRTANAYTFGDFEDLFEEECGGTCNGGSVSWSTLEGAAEDEFGVGSSKAAFLTDTGDGYGVD